MNEILSMVLGKEVRKAAKNSHMRDAEVDL
jgi:hypothetical protein